MKALFSSDWQASYENLELCSKAAEEILRIKEEQQVEVLVLCGDLKHIYNPIDLRIVNFWQRTIKNWIKAGMEVVVVLGNHDRLGMHNEKPNWMPVLRNVGAKCFDQPDFYDLRDGYRLACLPFRQSSVLRRTEAHDLASHARPDRDILVFHADLKGARYNVLSRSPEDNMASEDLRPQRYMYCIGGHLHMQQRVGAGRDSNVWFTGSPFATDWGEANQRKGYLLVDVSERKTIRRVPSTIPGWYDPRWPGFEEAKPETWIGAHVRIKVHCEGNTNVAERIRSESEIARRNYPGARLSIVPEFVEESREGLGRIRAAQPDDRKIRIYLQENLPDSLRGKEAKIQEYLLEQLRQVGGVQREGGELKFRHAQGKNFLSYKALNVKFNEGLNVISGKNRDWLDKSNGSGKTSYLQMIAVALFGQTFKGQKHDRWMRKGTAKGDESFIKVSFRDSQDRVCIVTRGRQPKGLWLKVNGRDIEAGNRPEATQGLIEQLTGYTWETLSNAVYVDQGNTHLMLTGTEAQRKGFLAKLQNLERFERAEKRIREDRTEYERKYELVRSEIEATRSSITEIENVIEEVRQTMGDWKTLVSGYKTAKKFYIKKKQELESWEATAARRHKKIVEMKQIQEQAKYKLVAEYGKTFARKDEFYRRMKTFDKIEGECPTCFQPIDRKHAKKHLMEWNHGIQVCTQTLTNYDKQLETANRMIKEFDEAADKWLRNKNLAGEVSDAREAYVARKRELQEYKRNKEMLTKVRQKIVALNRQKAEKEERRGKISRKLEVIKYAQTVFQRNGLPAYLNAQVCPELNQAAKEYSEMFAQSEIQVRFAVDEEGRMDVQVVNAHGGENVEDQSEGEMKLASLITAFAVRSLAPKTNILILDEPGDGLDATSARNFASGLREVSKKFCIIMLTTHNPVILSELADSRMIEIVKRNGISRVMEEA